MSEVNTIGFAGLSHLGIIYSMAAAARNFSVLAFDDRPGLAENLARGRFPISEPGLEEAFRDHGRRIRYTGDIAALGACPVIFITLDVQTDDADNSYLAPLECLIDRVTASAAPGSILVIMSQAPPGFCRKLADRVSAKVQIFYQVETLIFGNALERAMYPERHIVGCAEVAGGLPDVYRQYLEAFKCPVAPMRYESAELCKIAINCFLVSSVCTSNMLAEVCEKIGADWSEITPALRLDKRIGPQAYLNPGLGISGGNLERDLVTVRKLAAENGCDAGLVTAWRQDSVYRKNWALRTLYQQGLLNSSSSRLLGLWGLAYKPDTHSTKNSPSIDLIRALTGHRLLAYDPAVRLNVKDLPHVRICDAPLEAAQDVEGLIIMTPWKEFSQAPLRGLRQAMRGIQLLDPFAILDGDACRKMGFDYHRLGA